MLDTIKNFFLRILNTIPDILVAILLLVIAFVAANIVKSLVVKLMGLIKTDKLNKTEYGKMLAEMAEHPLTKDVVRIPFSSLSGAGKNELWKIIYEYTGL